MDKYETLMCKHQRSPPEQLAYVGGIYGIWTTRPRASNAAMRRTTEAVVPRLGMSVAASSAARSDIWVDKNCDIGYGHYIINWGASTNTNKNDTWRMPARRCAH